MAFCWPAEYGPTMKQLAMQLCDFRAPRPVLLRNPYIFVIFQGGGGSLDPRMDPGQKQEMSVGVCIGCNDVKLHGDNKTFY